MRIENVNNAGIFEFLKWYFFPQGTTFPYIVWFRILQFCKKNKFLKYSLGLVAYIIYRHYSFKYGIHLNSNIKVGKGLYIVHGEGVYLNCQEIGENFTVYQGVTLGSADKDSKIGPVVEDNVTIYTGAVVVGDICIHEGAIIGANSFINKDVPAQTLAIGNNLKKINRNLPRRS